MSSLCESTIPAVCICIRQPQHPPPHVCACRGAWWFDSATGHNVPYALPTLRDAPLLPEQAEAYAETLKPFTFEQAMRAVMRGMTELAETLDHDASIGDLRNMTIGDLGVDARRN